MAIEPIDWLSKALDMFPELEDKFEYAHISPMSFWIELHLALLHAYEQQPSNDDLIGRIYDYAAWCFDQPQTNSAETDLSTAVACCLIEHLPLDRAVAEDLHRWMSAESFDGFESVFRYHLSEEQYITFRNDFMRRKRMYSGASRL
ncbi:MAG TPA: hypothetical protein VFB76_08065 [Candidatus Angelobacter sp.]|nr:hypothetical protein [Candidatus Angelobacter sp.]